MVDLNGSWLRFIDADKMTLAFLSWDPLAGIAGAFFGDAHATGRAATWEIQFPDGRRARGVSRAGNIFPETLCVELRTVEDWMGELSSSIEPAPKGPPAIECEVVFGAPLRITDLPADKQYVRTEIRFSSDIDLSPLANLATAVAWGLALERVVTEWRAWHPAASIDWHVSARSLRLLFAIDGIGVVNAWSGRFGTVDLLAAALRDAKTEAAHKMAPHYVAPAPKPTNRDAALRRFADEMRAAKAADRGAA